MGKVKKFMLRCLISFIIMILIIIMLIVILKIKYKGNESNYSWDWGKEDTALYFMLKDKYPDENSSNFPVIMMKNQDIPKKEDNEKRILVIGDSFTYGYSGTNVNYTWWKQLNLQIKKSGYSNVNVYATGRYYTNTKDELEKVLKNEELMEKIDPDLIIIGYVYNDPEERDENGLNILREDWQPGFPGNLILKMFPEGYEELKNYYNRMSYSYDTLKKFGNLIGFYRSDVRALMLAEGKNLENYKKVLKELDDYAKKIGIPYFYYFTENTDLNFIKQASMNVFNAMKELKINVYYTPYDSNKIMTGIENVNEYSQYVNPVDYHPGIIWTYDCGKKVFEILKEDYSFIFEDAKFQDINELDLNINDTMPFLEINKIEKNVFKFEYPESENIKYEYITKFLYYPIEKNYVKLNLEYPKKVSKVIIGGENLKSVELYVNTIDPKYGYDLNEARKVLTPCKKIGDGTYEVGYEITSLNISVEFIDESNRNISVEFVEEH